MRITVKTSFLEELHSLSSSLEKLSKLDISISYFALFPKRKELIYIMEKGPVKLLFDASKYIVNIGKSNIIEKEMDEYYFKIGDKELAKILRRDFEDIDIDIECDVKDDFGGKYATYNTKIIKGNFEGSESGTIENIHSERLKEIYETLEDGKKYDIIYEGMQIDSYLESHTFDKKSDIGIIFENSDPCKVISISSAKDVVIEEEVPRISIYKNNEIDIRIAEILFLKIPKMFSREKVIIAREVENLGKIVFKLCTKDEKEQIIIVFGSKEKVNNIKIEKGSLILTATEENAIKLLRSFKRLKSIAGSKISIKTIKDEKKLTVYGYNYMYGIYFEERLNVDNIEKDIRATLSTEFLRQMSNISSKNIEIYETNNIISVISRTDRNVKYSFMTINEIIYTKGENEEEYNRMVDSARKLREIEKERSKNQKYGKIEEYKYEEYQNKYGEDENEDYYYYKEEEEYEGEYENEYEYYEFDDNNEEEN